MLPLSGFASWAKYDGNRDRVLLRLSEKPIEDDENQDAFLFRGGALEDGPGWVVTFDRFWSQIKENAPERRTLVLPDSFDYLREGDIVRFVPGRNAFRVLFRTSANANYFLTTERCNHYCLMCSQPPKDVADDWLADEIIETIQLLPPSTEFVGITGGEPTLIGDSFFKILLAARESIPSSAVHILTNGRSFSSPEFTRRYAQCTHPGVSVGIPLYSADPAIHDYVVQARGAFDETIAGIMNLKSFGQKVELRVVVHKQTYEGLEDLSEFIFRNLTFVDHVAFMGLEITGFTRANFNDLWIDPFDYQSELARAVRYLDAARINASIYNHQLCLLEPSVHRFARRSISDWKNDYAEECSACSKRDECGGFFESSKLARSQHIAPI